MSKPRRIVVILYCLLVAYCLIWIPWCIPHRNQQCQRVGYGWLWAGPAMGSPSQYGFVPDNDPPWELARPDREIIVMRLIAATVVCGAVFGCATLWGFSGRAKKDAP
jgi:hypothetical protein